MQKKEDYYITKVSGEQEKYDRKKLERSLLSIGVKPPVIKKIIKTIEEKYPHITNTKQIFSLARSLLYEKFPGLASRYNLKKGLIMLGPAGYPFERYISFFFDEKV